MFLFSKLVSKQQKRGADQVNVRGFFFKDRLSHVSVGKEQIPSRGD